MGLSVAISGGIILTVFVLILLSLPGLADKMFSIGDVTTQVTQHEQKISNTEISMNYLSQSIGSPRVNFTLGNDGSEKLWNFEDYDLFIEYDGAISGQTTQQLSYNGECLGVVPPAGNWCIQSISNDVADPKILNSGEQASIWTNLSENLASKTAIITLVTDNGVTFTTARNLITTITSVTTLTANEEIVLVNPSTTAFTVTLPPVSGNAGMHYLIKYVATTGTVVTIDGNGAETINIQPTVKLEYPYSSWDLYTDGTRWYGSYTDSSLPPVQQIIAQDDFLSSATTSGGVGVHGTLSWSLTGVNAETALYIDGVIDHAGIKRMGTGGASGDDANIFLASTVAEQTVDADDTFDITWIIRIPTITSVISRVGLTVTPTSNSEAAAENAMFIFDPASDASWTCRTRSVGGVDQSSDSTLDVVAGTWYKLRIVKDGGTIRFLINDVNLCNHSLQIPTSTVIPFATVDTTAAAVRQLDLDYFRGSFIMSGR
jgi:hypothetical protein